MRLCKFYVSILIVKAHINTTGNTLALTAMIKKWCLNQTKKFDPRPIFSSALRIILFWRLDFINTTPTLIPQIYSEFEENNKWNNEQKRMPITLLTW